MLLLCPYTILGQLLHGVHPSYPPRALQLLEWPKCVEKIFIAMIQDLVLTDHELASYSSWLTSRRRLFITT